MYSTVQSIVENSLPLYICCIPSYNCKFLLIIQVYFRVTEYSQRKADILYSIPVRDAQRCLVTLREVNLSILLLTYAFA